MKIIDAHCDVLYKMWKDPALDFADAKELDASLRCLVEGQVHIQLFALFVPPEVKAELQFQAVLEMIDLFHERILNRYPQMKQIYSWEDVYHVRQGQIGAMLTLEGGEAIGNDPVRLRTLYRLGVKSIGLTWNHANLLADGSGESRGAGLTEWGKTVVKWNNRHQVWTDVSHLSEQAFWDVLDLARYPVASHSNAKAICSHPRNLDDRQAKALFAKNGYLGIVFHPPFLSAKAPVTISEVISHLDHFCQLDGAQHVGFGSDFDGIDTHVQGLENASLYPDLINQCLKHYSEAQVRGFAYENFMRHIPRTEE